MQKHVQETILSIYDTIAEPDSWAAILDQIADKINARGCLIFELEEKRLLTPFHSSWYQPESLQAYNKLHLELELSDHEIFRQHSFMGDEINIIPDSVLYDNLSEFKKRSNVKHVMEFGILHRAAALLNKDNPNLSRFSVQFKKDRGPINGDESQYLNTLLPHIAKALDLAQISSTPKSEHSKLIASADQLSIGICILDKAGKLVHSNEEFRRQQEEYNVFRFQADGKFALHDNGAQLHFSQLKSHVNKHGNFGARPRKEAITANADTFLCVEITPLTKSEELGSKPFEGFIVYSTDTSRPQSYDLKPLASVFDLTSAEMEIIDLISKGHTNFEISEIRDRSRATINSQVKSVLSKTHCSTRTQLVRLMLSYNMSPTNS